MRYHFALLIVLLILPALSLSQNSQTLRDDVFIEECGVTIKRLNRFLPRSRRPYNGETDLTTYLLQSIQEIIQNPETEYFEDNYDLEYIKSVSVEKPQLFAGYRRASVRMIGPDEVSPARALISFILDLIRRVTDVPSTNFLCYFYEDLNFELERIFCEMELSKSSCLSIEQIHKLKTVVNSNMKTLKYPKVHFRY